MKKRLTGLMLLCLVLATTVLGRAIYIQVIGDQRLSALSKRQFNSKFLVRPRRGMVLDRNGEPLAVNTEVQSLAANPNKIENKKALAKLISKSTDIPVSKILTKLKDKKEFVWIKRHLTDRDLDRLKKWQIITSSGDLMSGFWMVKESKRTYPHGELAAHVLGDVNLDHEGLEGVELLANEQLRGKVVSVRGSRDALGRPTFMDAVAAKDAKDGEAVTLTIDASLQFSVEEELKNSIQKTGAKSGTVIVMDASNGEILAMANQPTFNPNYRSSSSDYRRNRAVTDGYEPGSTIKPILLAAALAHGSKLSDQLWAERGTFTVQGKRISEAEAHEKFEWIDLKKMIQVSSNVGAAKLALKLGADKYYESLKSFGFSSRTTLGFPGEISGVLPPRKNWQPLALANIGFGQGLLVTPMQMVRAYAALANGGWLLQPTLLKSSVSKIPTVPPKRVISEQVAASVVKALLSVTQEGGTGTKAGIEGYEIAGKTGTAQTVDPKTKSYSKTRYISSFIGFALDVEPKLVIFTALDDPRGIYYASETAVPLFRSVMNAVATRFSMPSKSTRGPELANLMLEEAKKAKPSPQEKARVIAEQSRVAAKDQIKSSSASAMTVSLAKVSGTTSSEEAIKGPWKMPSLKGLTVREVLRDLKGHKYQISISGSGIVNSQSPEEGRVFIEGSHVRLQLVEP